MQSTRYLPVAIATLFLATAAAKDGRDFAGFYSLTNATTEGRQVRVTATLQVFNYSGADLNDATITIRTAPPESAILGSYAIPAIWHSGTDLKFTMHITVPLDEYQRWGGRRQPAIIITSRDDQGRELQRTAQMNQRPTIPLESNSAAQ